MKKLIAFVLCSAGLALASISGSQLTPAVGQSSAGSTLVSASTTCTTDSIILVAVEANLGTGNGPGAISSVAGCGLTFVNISSLNLNYGDVIGTGMSSRFEVWRAKGTGGTGAITITWATSPSNRSAVFSKFSGALLTGTNGADAIGITGTGHGDSVASPAPASVTMGAFGSSSNATYAAAGTYYAQTMVAGSSMSILGTVAGPTVADEWSVGNVANPQMTWVSGGATRWGMVSVELIAAGGGGPPPPAGTNNYYVKPGGSDTNSEGSVLNSGGATAWATINYAIATAVLGAAPYGTIIHVADGTYLESSASCSPIGSPEALCFNHGGTSTQPFVVQCDNGLNGAAGHPGSPGHCLIRKSANTANPQFVTIAGVDYVTLQGFDIGGDSAYPQTLVQAGILVNGKETPTPKGNFVNIQYNYVHDMATAANDGNGFGNGCTSEAMIVTNFNNQGTARIPTDDHIIGNFVNNGGSLTNPSCNQWHGIYFTCPRCIIENNIVGNQAATGIKVYPYLCSEVVSNNLVYHNGWWGMLVKDNGLGNCAQDGYTVGQTTIHNNIAINNGFNNACGGIMLGNGSQGTNRFADNLLLGNLPNDNIVQMNTSAGCSSASISGAIGTINGASGATLANTFVNYQQNGTGNYHLASGSLAVGAGDSSCVSGGITPCIPTVDLEALVRPSPLSIGPYEYASPGATPHVTPSSVSFGSVNIGSSSLAQTFTFTNSSSSSVSISTVASSNNSEFPKTNDLCTGRTVAANTGTCTFQVAFAPTATGTRASTVTISGTGPGLPVSIALTGTGVTPGQASFNVTSQAYGSVTVGASASHSFSLFNPPNGSSVASLSISLSTGTQFRILGNTCNPTLPVSGTCTVNVGCNPTATGVFNDVLLAANAASYTPSVSLTCTGVAAPSPGGNPQTHNISGTEPLQQVNAAWVNGIAPGYWPTNCGGLTLCLSSGTVNCNGTITGYGGGTLTMANNTTNYIYLDVASSCAPATNASPPSCVSPKISTVVTSGGAITAITDLRLMANYCP